MRRVLCKTLKKEYRRNAGCYIALFSTLLLIMYIVGMAVGTTYAYETSVRLFIEESNREDGEFIMSEPLSDEEIASIEGQGYMIEDERYFDYTDNGGTVFRVTKTRKNINLFIPDEGSLPQGDNEIAIINSYGYNHDRTIGEIEGIGHAQLNVCAIGSVPDYELPLRFFTDETIDNSTFCLAIVADNTYERLLNSNERCKETYVYSYIADKEAGNIILPESDNKVLLKISDRQNPRMNVSIENLRIYMIAGIGLGIVISLLASLAMAIKMKERLMREQSEIGALLIDGCARKNIVAMYTMPAMIVAALAGTIGYLLSLSPAGNLIIESNYLLYSVPYYDNGNVLDIISPVAAFFCIAVPVLISLLITGLTIYHNLCSEEVSILAGIESRTKHRTTNRRNHISQLGYMIYRTGKNAATMLSVTLSSICVGILFYYAKLYWESNLVYGVWIIYVAVVILGLKHIVQKNVRQIGILSNLGYSRGRIYIMFTATYVIWAVAVGILTLVMINS